MIEPRIPVRVGNDVVDLADPRKRGKAADDRFVRRILDPSERAALAGATDADLELWHHWAAKEVAFKVVSKLLGAPPPFDHARFVARWLEAPGGGHPEAWREGVVTYLDMEIPVRVRHTAEYLLATGWAGRGAGAGAPPGAGHGVATLAAVDSPWAGAREALEARLTERERDAVHSRESAAVRLAARAELAGAMAVEESRLQIVCAPGVTGRRPPYVLLDDSSAEADVSLAHDGPWIAWAWWAQRAVGR